MSGYHALVDDLRGDSPENIAAAGRLADLPRRFVDQDAAAVLASACESFVALDANEELAAEKARGSVVSAMATLAEEFGICDVADALRRKVIEFDGRHIAGVRGAVIGECAWCGAEIESEPKPPPGSNRGEIFCSVAHRDASGRAVKSLLDRVDGPS